MAQESVDLPKFCDLEQARCCNTQITNQQLGFTPNTFISYVAKPEMEGWSDITYIQFE